MDFTLKASEQTQQILVPRFAGVLAGAVVVAVSVSSCGNEPPSASPIPERTFLVETTEARTKDIRVTINAVGTVEASEEARIQPQVDAVIAEILFEEGAVIPSGAMLVRLDDRKAQAKRALALAALDSAKAKLKLRAQRLDRHKALIAEKLISDEEFESIEAEYQEAEAGVREGAAALTLAERELDEYHLRAPFSGTVGERIVDVGNYVTSGTTLTVVIATDPIEVSFRAPDRYAEEIRTGTEVTIARSGSGMTIDGIIDFVDPRVDASTRMLSLRASVDNPDNRLLHGQFVQVSILVAERANQVIIPEEAILSASGNNWAFVVKDGIAERREITLGERHPPTVEILEGIEAGNTIVVGGQHRLRDGVSVKPVEPIKSPEGD